MSTLEPEIEGLFTGKFSTSAALERMRMRLLDLSIRNGLLNYRFPKRRALRIIDTPIDGLFERLYVDGKESPILPVPDPPRALYDVVDGKPRKPDVREYAEYLDLNVSYEISDNTKRENSTELQSLLYPEDLERHLRELDQLTRTALEESGANILYLVFGYLGWREVESSDREMLAPLLVLPVALKRTGVDPRTGYFRYSLEYTGEDLTDNITLREKLRRDFSLELPCLGDDDGPEEYFAKIDEFADARPAWQVRRCVTLCLLSFGKLLMYLDLDRRRWPAVAPIDKNPLVSRLFEGTPDYLGDTFAEEYDIDAIKEIPLIYDADSSQHSAVVDALQGKNLVIEGPPGTGKSQTITNLIAAALTDGKTVLFVSEKLAALEVVKRRLDNAQLGSFCLEFHSHKTQKRRILDDIKSRLDQVFLQPTGIDQKRAELEQVKARLTKYVTFMNRVAGNKLGLTVHQILWASDRYRSQLNKSSVLASAEFSFAPTVESLSEFEEALQQLKRHLISSGSYGPQNPWWGYFPDRLLFGDEETIAGVLMALRDTADGLAAFITASEQRLGIPLPKEEQESRKICTRLAIALRVPTGSEGLELLPDLISPDFSNAVVELQETISYITRTDPLMRSRFRAADSVDQEVVDKCRTLKDLSSRLNQLETKASLISYRVEQIRDIARGLQRAIELFSDGTEATSLQLKPTQSDFAVMASVFNVAKECPLNLLDSRSEPLRSSGALRTLQEGHEEAAALLATRSQLQENFELNLLPSREELASTLRCLSAKSGPLRFTSPSWWKARALHNSISVNRVARIKPDQRIQEIRDLLAYVDDYETFDNKVELRQLIGSRYDGLATRFEELERLVAWNYKVEAELRPHVRPRQSVDFVEHVTNLRETGLRWLSARASDADAAAILISELGNELVGIFTTDDQLPNITVGRDQPLDHLVIQLTATCDQLDSIPEYITKNFQTDESIQGASKLLDELLGLRAALKLLGDSNAVCQRLGERYRGLATDFEPVLAAQRWAQEISEAGFPESIGTWLLNPEALKRSNQLALFAETVLEKWDEIDEFFSHLRQFGTLNYVEWYRQQSVEPTLVRNRATEAINSAELLVTWADLSRAIDRSYKLGLKSVCSPTLTGLLTPDELIPAFRYVLYSSIAKSLFRKNPGLMQFSGLSHQQIRDRFQDLDREVLELNRKKCGAEISRRPVPAGVSWGYVRDYTDLALLRHEIDKKRRHVPIRQLVRRAGGALQALKPCFMMSPLSVAQYLEPGMRSFDLIVIDEASQVKPEDSIGAIARGSQVVVVGDPKQLPPTTFFDAMTDEPEDDDEISALEEGESILDVSRLRFQPPRRLRWHYRSQHHSLISFSNTHFYKDRPLFVFPSPFETHDGLGIHWHHVQNAVYENRQNRREATEVTNAIVEHMRKFPQESLGVVTLNVTQRDLIQDEFDNQLKSHPQIDQYLNSWKVRAEPFFIKNLENVQGDERDVIFISTTYGRNNEGAFHQRFGPITLPLGWRRLNVLFTRAKRRIDLFTSMEPEDIRIDSHTSLGTQALRNYLTFAKTGVLETFTIPGREPDSDFEIAVGDVIKNSGYEIVPQLGVAGFFIDIAVRHPDRGGEFLAAIECDGATYHSTRSARDRDRLRQEILEQIGWKDRIYRVWSADWFKDPRTQTRRLLDFLGTARERTRNVEEQITAEIHEPLSQVNLFSSETKVPANPKPADPDDSLVQVWDYVTYRYRDDPESHKSVQIVKGHTDVEKGVVGDKMPLARALLGSAIGDNAELNLPGRPVRLIEVLAIER